MVGHKVESVARVCRSGTDFVICTVAYSPKLCF